MLFWACLIGNMSRLRSQSAMEYLMTYGWAILVITVILGALYSLNIFNIQSLSPKVQSGSCQIYRSNSGISGTTRPPILEGICNNGLPQMIGQFDGSTSNVILGTSLTSNTAYSISVWIKRSGPITGGSIAIINGSHENLFMLSSNSVRFALLTAVPPGYNQAVAGLLVSSKPITDNNWHHVVVGYSAFQQINFIAVDGNYVSQSVTAISCCSAPSGYQTVAGVGLSSVSRWNGQMANIQIYNTSLDPTTIQTLYSEGLGGIPVSLQSLVGWWPLNGDANDYSGNGNNGVPSNTIFTTAYSYP
jgi:hypothetical protein